MPSAATCVVLRTISMPPKVRPMNCAREFVMVAGHEDHARAVPHFAQQLLNDVVVGLRPVPARPQPPAVDDVADEEDRVGVVVAKEIEHQLGLAAARAQMQVGDEDGAIASDQVFGLGQGSLGR